ncbi:penicillin-binding transpeptidase domain-containing protein, partial [Nonomuraea sp. NPDC003201]
GHPDHPRGRLRAARTLHGPQSALGTGEIRALAASRAPGPGGRPPADRFGFQQGTTAMVYTLTAALESGMRYDDGFPYLSQYRAANYHAFKNCKGQNVAEPSFSILNRQSDHGAFTTLRSGTRTAENTFFMKLTEKVGLCESVQVAKRLGLKRADGLPFQEFETFSLGINEVDPVSLAGSYATLAAHGRRCEPRLVTEVRGGSGVVRSFPARCQEALEPAVADAVTGVLAEALAKGPLKGLGRDAAGMEGTADAFSTAWYAGYTPDLASAVALGDPRGAVAHKLSDITVGGRRYRHVEGTSIPGPIWKSSMTEALAGSAGTAFAKPDLARFGGCRDHCAP